MARGVVPTPTGVSLQSPYVSAIILATTFALALIAFWRAESVPLRRKARGLPRADPRRVAQHDQFNLCMLPVLVAWDATVIAGQCDAFDFTLFFLLYLLADLCWIWLCPQAVPQPALVLTHHVGVLALLSHPIRWAEHATFTAWVGIVEVNTVILVARRYYASFLLQSGSSAAGSALRSVVRQSLSVLYWTSFIIIRFGVHPYVVWLSMQMDVPLLERVLLVGLLSSLVVFSVVLLVKQLFGIWDGDARSRRAQEPLPQFELFLKPTDRAAPGVLEFPLAWGLSRSEPDKIPVAAALPGEPAALPHLQPSPAQRGDFIQNLMNFVLKMMNFVLK